MGDGCLEQMIKALPSLHMDDRRPFPALGGHSQHASDGFEKLLTQHGLILEFVGLGHHLDAVLGPFKLLDQLSSAGLQGRNKAKLLHLVIRIIEGPHLGDFAVADLKNIYSSH
jgi:hypothetical protein